MKKRLAFTGIVIAAVLLTACGGPKVSLEGAKKIAADDAGVKIDTVVFTHTTETDTDGVVTYELVFSNDDTIWTYHMDGDGNITECSSVPMLAPEISLANPGNAGSNPVFDPYNLINNVGVDQSAIESQLTNKDYSSFSYDYDDRDVYAYNRGLPDSYINSNQSYMQIHTEKGTMVPFRLTYLNYYSDTEERPDAYGRFSKDYEMLLNDLEAEYGEPYGVGYMSLEGDKTDYADENDLIDELPQLQKDEGYTYAMFDAGDNEVYLQARYNGGTDEYEMTVDFY